MPTFTSDERKILIRYASTLPSGSPERKAVLAGLSLTAAGYARKSMRGGDYGGAGSSKQLVKDMIANMRRVKTNAERSHAVEQVQHAEAAKSITSQQAKEVMGAIGKAASARTAEWKGWTEDMPVQVVMMRGTEVFPNLAAAQKKYPDLDPTRNTRRFTWTTKGSVRGRPAIRFEDWEVEKSMSRAASRTAEDWMEDAVKRPGRLHKFFGIPEDETIPMSKIDGEIAKLKKKDDRTKDEESLLDALNLGKTFKEMKKSAAGEEHYIGDEEAGVYWSVDETPRGWFVQAWVDGGHFTHDFPKDGPYPTEGEAMEAGWSQGLEWVVTNDVSLAGEPKTFPAWARRNRWQPRTASSDDRIALIRYASTLPVGSDERKAILSGMKTAALDSVSLGEMMVSAAAQARLFYRLDMKRFVGVYEEVGENLIRIGHTSDPDDRAFLVSEVDKGLADLKKHNITAMSEALEHMTRAYALVSKAYR